MWAVLPSLAFAAAAVAAPPAPARCAQVFYDAVPAAKPAYAFGRAHALELQNLLGHFPAVRQIVVPVERYRRGMLDRCATNFYLGTYFDNPLPAAFLADFAASSSTVVWLGYNAWRLPPGTLERAFEVRYRGLSTLDAARKDARGRPSFHRFVDYKGQTFEKFGEWAPADPSRFDAAYEVALYDPLTDAARASVVAWARRDAAPEERTPYALVRGKRWLVADTPFSYITESDRYLVFADLLFDMLGEPPRRGPGEKKPALFRVEDAHAMLPRWQLYGMADMLERLRAPFSVAVIPMWVDALGVMRLRRRWRLASDDEGFKEFLRYASERGASFILHGLTHQRGFARNPFTGISGDDFEFWDREDDRPIAGETAKDAAGRVADARRILEAAGVVPSAWMTPHYQASELDARVFARAFEWSVGRMIYRPRGAKDGDAPIGQFFPYEIDGDFYGSRVVPENVGNAQPYLNDQVLRAVTIDDMIRVIRRNAVLRDSWASFFVHPSMLETRDKGGVADRPGDTRELERLVAAARESGYEFVSLSQWTAAQRSPLRAEPEEVMP